MSACADGWEDDNALFHQADCNLPSVVYVVNLVYCVIVAVLLIAVYASRLAALKGDMRSVFVAAIWVLVSSITLAVGLWAQRGMMEVATISVVANIIISSHLAKLILVMALRPASKLSKEASDQAARVFWFWRRFNIVANTITASFGLAGLIVMRDGVAWHYNTCMLGILFVAASYLLLLPTAIMYFLLKLERVLHEVEHNAPAHQQKDGKERLSDFARRLRMLRLFVLAEAAWCPMLLVVGVLFVAWGGLPYAWVVMLIMQQTTLVIGFSVMVFFRRTKHASSSVPDSSPDQTGPLASPAAEQETSMASFNNV